MSRPSRWSRQLDAWERAPVWVALTALVSGGALVGAAMAWGLTANARGHTRVGLLLGLLALLLFALSGVYSWRKRVGQEGRLRGTRMTVWLWSHVALGMAGAAAALAHAGMGALHPRLTSGWLLLGAAAALVLTGVVWRAVYARLPATQGRKLGGDATHATEERARRHANACRQLAAGGSPLLRALTERAIKAGGDVRTWPDVNALDREERDLFGGRIADSVTAHHTELAKLAPQAHFVGLVQGWRLLHIPLALATVLLVPLHILAALEVPAAVGVTTPALTSSESCADCHATIVDQWRDSMHAHALTSPLTVVQNNVAVRETLGSHGEVCVNCHGPLAAEAAGTVTLPFPDDGSGAANEGVGCVTCHALALDEAPAHWMKKDSEGRIVPELAMAGNAGLDAFRDAYARVAEYAGLNATPTGNSAHRSTTGRAMLEPGELCNGCHNVILDRDGDGVVRKGEDLVLQSLMKEWEAYRLGGGDKSCVDCHMPDSATPVVDGDRVPFAGVDGTVTRTVRSHAFVGVDHALDAPVERTHRAEREALLRSALDLQLSTPTLTGDVLKFGVTLTNVGAGHNVPSGFAFARQLWLEVRVTDALGRVLLGSGIVKDPADDLCDPDTMRGGIKLRGCTEPSPQLVNLQAMLLDEVRPSGEVDALGMAVLKAAGGASETSVQTLTAGAVARTRRNPDGSTMKLVPLTPKEISVQGSTATYPYRVNVAGAVGEITVSVRLLFRNLPPYFLRELQKLAKPGDGPDLDALTRNLQILDVTPVGARANATADAPASASWP